MENRMKNVQKIMSMLLLFMALPLAGMEGGGDSQKSEKTPWWQSKTALVVGVGTAAVGGWAAYKLLQPKQPKTVIQKVMADVPSAEAVAQAGKQ